MIKSLIEEIFSSNNIAVGKKLILDGRFRRGAPSSEIVAVEREFLKIQAWYLDELVVLDFTKLLELDSIGIRNTITHIVRWNKELISKSRFPIATIGNIKSDIYLAVEDKFPDEDLKKVLPWYNDENEYLKAADID